MKKQSPLFMLLMTTMLVTMFIVMGSFRNDETSLIHNREWEKLAQAKVNQGLNHDEMNLSEENKPFSAVKIRSVSGGVNLHRCTFHYKNGEKLNVEMRNDIPAGTDSRTIQLPAKKSPIIKVEFWYDTKNYSDQKAVLELWGKP